MRIARIVLVAAAAVSRGASADAQVVGGTPVAPGTWPDAVAVIGATGTCSGTLVAPDVVLTAGHCADIDPQRIVAGTVYAIAMSEPEAGSDVGALSCKAERTDGGFVIDRKSVV